MKATSIRLETFVEINSNELEKLKNSSLKGIVKIYDDPNPERCASIEIEYAYGQEELLIVNWFPDEYFCNAREIKFKINPDYYEVLHKYRICVERFYTAGKLQMKLEGRED